MEDQRRLDNRINVSHLHQGKVVEQNSNMGDNQKLIEEVHTYQTKIEKQNEELKKAQKKILEEQKRYKDLFMNAPIAYITLNKKGGILEINYAASEMLKISMELNQQYSIFSYISEQSRETFTNCFNTIFDNSKSECDELIFCNENGEHIYGSLIAETYFEEDSNESFLRCSIVENTKTRKHQEELEKKNRQLKEAIDEANLAKEKSKSINDKLNKANFLLEKEKLQFLSILNNIPEMIYVADIDTHEILFSNNKLNKIIGRDITGEKCYEAIQKKSEPCTFCTNKFIKKTDDPYFWEHYNQNLEKHFYILDRKIDWGTDKQVRFEMAIDVTVRKDIEKQLQEDDWLLNQMGDIAETGGWKIDLNSQKLSWTQEVFSIHEIDDNKQPTIEEGVAFYDEKSLPVIQKALDKTIKTGEPFDEELSIITAKGNRKDVRARGRKQKEEHGESIIGVFQDITELKKNEKEIREINKKYKQLFEFMPVGVSIADNEGQLLENNKEAERLLGMSSEEHNERTIDAAEWKLIRKDGSVMPSEEFASVRALKENKLVENVEMGIWKGEDNVTWINVSAAPSVSGDGLIISYIDISEKVAREKKLREANATKDKFFNIIAHDLKNPFNTIQGFTSLLRKNLSKYDHQKVDDFLERIEDSSFATYKLLENLLEWSRMQTGKIQFFPDTIIAEKLVLTVLDQKESMALAKDIKIDYEIKEGITFQGDENMLIATLRNLLSNSIKFSHEGEVILVKVDQNKEHTLFEVIDNGVGMDKDTISKLFKVDEKISMPGTNSEMGTGLGLLLCKEFVEMHKGKISVESTLEKGSKFSFTIPNS